MSKLHVTWIEENHCESRKTLTVAAPQVTLNHYLGDSLTKPMPITAFSCTPPKGHQEPRSEVRSLSPAEHRVGI